MTLRGVTRQTDEPFRQHLLRSPESHFGRRLGTERRAQGWGWSLTLNESTMGRVGYWGGLGEWVRWLWTVALITRRLCPPSALGTCRLEKEPRPWAAFPLDPPRPS